MLSDKSKNLVIIFLTLGILLKLYLTSNGHFIFHMDVARDFLDVREMFLVHKLRLIGPTSAIAGVFSGPAWYYLLSIPYLITAGHPYFAVVLMILSWAIGGWFLFKLLEPLGFLPILLALLLWLGSNYLQLTTSYSFHPHMITLLTPLFIWLLLKSLSTQKPSYGYFTWALAGAFFNFEMNFGVFLPLIILFTTKGSGWFKGLLIFGLFLLPQVLFDVKNHLMMSQALWSFITHGETSSFNLSTRIHTVAQAFYSALLPTFLNSKVLTNLFLPLSLLSLFLKRGSLNTYYLILTSFILIPFFSFILIPVTVNSWHLGGIVSAAVILSGLIVSQLWRWNTLGKTLVIILLLITSVFALNNVSEFLKEQLQPYGDQSGLINEEAAVDYVYTQAGGKNFKVYSYLPSVYDYPYQYLFPWYGLKRYGYLPKDYAYLPHKPAYIKDKQKITTPYPPDSGLIFLIKEPDEEKRRQLWENSFKTYPQLKVEKLGPLEIDTLQDLTDY